MGIRVYNTLSREKEELKEIVPGEIRMYVCGPTVYDDSHLGHGRAAVVFDIIYRYLCFRGYKVIYVRNYTDVDDKIIARAQSLGISAKEVAERYIDSYNSDMKALGVLEPTITPKVSEEIPDIIKTIEILIQKGSAYVSGGDVFFSVRKFKEYGKLSGRSLEEMRAGARVEVNEDKEDPLDFALWKSAKPGEPKWESPWGEGRPGWHIECSVMSAKYLGVPFDIHGGGQDLIFPHHENEIAQSESAYSKKMVNYWIHNGFIQINREKMSKSVGNILLLKELLSKYHREVLRYFYASVHYRSPIDFSPENLNIATSALVRFYETLARIQELEEEVGKGNRVISEEHTKRLERVKEEFLIAMDDDFNTAKVIGLFNEFLKEVNQTLQDRDISKKEEDIAFLFSAKETLVKLGEILGIFQEEPKKFLEERKKRGLKELGLTEEEVLEKIALRDKARKNKEFKIADSIRNELFEKGIILEDTRKGTVWKIKEKG